MATHITDLRGKVKSLKRDFPIFSYDRIQAVLLEQNQEVARARIQLALAKKQEDQGKALISSLDADTANKFESPFALVVSAKDRPSALSSSIQPKIAPDLPARTSLTYEIDLNSSIESLESEKNLSIHSSQSSALSNDIIQLYTTQTGTTDGFERQHGLVSSHRRRADTAKREISPFALSKGSNAAPPRLVAKSNPKREVTINEMFQNSSANETRLQGTNRSARKRMRTFFDDIMDLPEEHVVSYVDVGVEVIEDPEEESFVSTKRRKLQLDATPHSSYLSQEIPQNQNKSNSSSRRSRTSSIRSSHTQDESTCSSSQSHHSQQNLNDSAMTLASRSKRHHTHMDRMKEEYSSEEEHDDSTTIANDSHSSDSINHIIEADSSSPPRIAEKYSMCSQPPLHAAVPRHQASRRMIMEDEDE
jgi:hypothetical protein